MSAPYSVMCFGDSLTWGWVPQTYGAPTTRYPWSDRWTGTMGDALGSGYRVLEEGLSGRGTTTDDPTDPRLNGSKHLPTALASHLPLDLLILMLGTNDTKCFLRREPFDIATGMQVLIGQAYASAGAGGTMYPAPKILLVAPPVIGELPHPYFKALFEGAAPKSRALPGLYAALADLMKVEFLDASQIIESDGLDGLHLTAETNRKLGLAMAAKVREILPPKA